VASCTCIPDYYGDPYIACHPECLTNGECSLTLACINNKCKNPCIGACSSINAECYVVNHKAMCTCRAGFTGDPFDRCVPTPSKTFEESQELTEKHIEMDILTKLKP
jgi:hypothetical protein